MIVLAGGNAYKLEHEHKNGWNSEAFKERFSDVLERYDYIVGDWGYSQLRLRGFYSDGNPRATKESTITCLVDYLNEYCNFGCAYFVLSKTDASAVPPGTPDLLEEAEPAPVPDPSSGEADAQTAETAAAAAGGNGILMRWPLKERPGGPVRVPGAAAMARAAQEAERRSQQAAQAQAKTGDHRSSQAGRGGQEAAYSGRPGGRPPGGAGSDKRSSGAPNAGQADRSGGRPGQGGRGPKPQGSERQGGGAPAKTGGQWRQQTDSGRHSDSPRVSDGVGQRPDSAKAGSRWPGKNRRRNRFGGKPNRPDGGPQGGGTPGKHGE